MGGRNPLRVKADEDDGGWSSLGGYMNAKIDKLNQQFNEKCNKLEKISNLFEGIAIHVNGYTSPTSDELKTIMAQHGGKYHSYYSSTSTTHVIASILPRSKIKELKPNQKVIKPEWIVDCLKEQKILPLQNYYAIGPQKSSIVGFIDKSNVKSGLVTTSVVSPAENLYDKPKETLTKTTRTVITPTADDSFLSEFYANSRLHHLSTWKTDLADFVRSLSEQKNYELSGRQSLMKLEKINDFEKQSKLDSKCIMHVDMDCFFVSVGLLSRPHLVDKPVAVTHHLNTSPIQKRYSNTDLDFEKKWYQDKLDHSKTKSQSHEIESNKNNTTSSDNSIQSFSDISSCNYIARCKGLRNGMMYGKAKELCPDLVAIPYDFEAYHDVSKQLYSILCSYTHSVEAVSCDEALLDVTKLITDSGISPFTVAKHIRNNIKEKTGCNASAGIGPNITLAKMATRKAKPNNQYYIKNNEAQSFMLDKVVKQLPGVGYVTSSRLHDMGVKTCGDLQNINIHTLTKEFGVKSGQKLFDLCRGIDKREVSQSKERKSFSVDVNYGIRLSSIDETKTFFLNLAKEVSNRLQKAEMKGKKLTLKLMVRQKDAPLESVKFGGHGICNSLSRSKNLDSFTNNCDVIAKEAFDILLKLKQISVADLRGVGIQITHLTSQSNSTNQTMSLHSFMTTDKKKNKDLENNKKVFKSELGTKSSVKVIDLTSPEINSLQNSCNAEEFIENILKPEKQVENSSLKKRKKMIKQSPIKLKTSRLSSKNSSPLNSPKKLITDMFKIVRKSKKESKQIDPVIVKQENKLKVKEEIKIQEIADQSPTLGDAQTVEEAREIIKNWVAVFNQDPPLDFDVNDLISYLLQLIKSKNLQGLDILIKTLKRSIQFEVVDQPSKNQLKNCWCDIFNHILSTIQSNIEVNYNGANLGVTSFST